MTDKSADTNSRPSPPSGEVGKQYELLMELLRELFQLDKGDLDFGLYRVMNMKAAEIEAFLARDLLPQARKNLARLVAEDIESLETEIQKKIVSYQRDGMTLEQVEKIPGIIERRAKLKSAREGAATEGHIYNHLYQFFSRYYDSGDFMSLRRIRANGDTSYLIPYNGEEVKLHWANADQYYIKTTENFASYIFGNETWPKAAKVRFEIAAADTEKDNIKAENGKDRRFVLTTRKDREPLAVDGDQLVAYFDHRPLTDAEAAALPGNNNVQAWLNAESHASILRLATKLDPVWAKRLAQPAPTENDPDRTLLVKHLAVYTAKNSFDYFIHKDLRGFLRRELDLYLKTEIIALDDFDPDHVEEQARLSRVLVLMSAVRSLGEKIIDFLAQLEDFHKSIWLKKKFVLETNYGITLDKVPESFYAEIAENEAQVAEWIELYALDKIEDFAKPLSASFLRENPHMAVDTKHFSKDFFDRLLTALTDGNCPAVFDDGLDGLLVHGENFQALNLLQERYKRHVQCVYIDPPYNAPKSEIAYKNNYKHSSFLSLLEGRLQLSREFSSADGSHIVAIDKNEQNTVFHLYREIFYDYDNVSVTIEHNRKGVQDDHFSFTHEYALFAIPPSKDALNETQRPGDEWDYTNFRNWGGESLRTDGANCFYPVLVKDSCIVGFGDVWSNEDAHPSGANVKRGDGVIEVYPIDCNGVERKWRYERGTVEQIIKKLKVEISTKGVVQIKIAKTSDQFKTVWYSPRYNAGDNGTRLLGHIGLPIGKFDYPKSIFTTYDCIYAVSDSDAVILDYFAGSGTTAHAVMNLNREDGGSRKYIMVEMGQHFETVLLPRIKKVAYSHDWKDGKPVGREGQSHFFKYIRLESHEDALDSLEVRPLENTGELFATNPELAEDYALRYQLSRETSGSASLCGGDFSRPNGYTLSVVRDGTRRDVAVDLPETFNYLIGLRVHARRVIENVLAISGIDAEETRCLILWRDIETTGNEALNAWFKAHGERIRKDFGARLVYVNGDHELGRLTPTDGAWTTSALELVFREKMFAGQVE